MSGSIILIGTGGNALDALDVIEAINHRAPTWTVRGFLDDVRPRGSECAGLPILGSLEEATRFEHHQFINVIGSDRSFRDREAIIARTGLREDQFATLIHPSASVSSRAQLDRGTLVNFGVSIAGNIKIGRHVALGAGCILGHDTQVEDYVVIAPGAVISGAVRLGRSCYIGARAAIRQNLQIGECCLIGMGAVVLKDVRTWNTVVGIPARPLESVRGHNKEHQCQ